MDRKDFDAIAKDLCKQSLNAVSTLLGLPNLNKKLFKLAPTEKATWIRRRFDYIAETPETIYHIEFQFQNDSSMISRMLYYYLLLKTDYPNHKIEQYIVYFGSDNLNMPNKISDPHLQFEAKLIDIRDISADNFLISNEPEVKLLAILAKTEDQKKTLREILLAVKEMKSTRYAYQLWNHLYLLANLRNLAEEMEKMSQEMDVIDVLNLKELPAVRRVQAELDKERTEKEQERAEKEQERLRSEKLLAILKAHNIQVDF